MGTPTFDAVEVLDDTEQQHAVCEDASPARLPSNSEDSTPNSQRSQRRAFETGNPPTGDVVEGRYSPHQANSKLEEPSQRRQWTVDVIPVGVSDGANERPILPQSVDETLLEDVADNDNCIQRLASSPRTKRTPRRISEEWVVKAIQPQPRRESFDRVPSAGFEQQGLAHSRWQRANWWATQEAHRRQQNSPMAHARPVPDTKESSATLLTNTAGVMHKVAKAKHRWLKNAQVASSSINVEDTPESAGRNGSGSSGATTSPTSPMRSSPVRLASVASRRPSMALASIQLEEERAAAPERGSGWRGWVIGWLREGLRHKGYSVLFLLVTLYVLFGEDAYILCDPPVSHDLVIFSISATAFFIFLLDLLARCFAEPGYALSFMCWLDVLACLSLLPSVVYAFGFGANGSGGAGSMLHMLRGGRAATTGARLARFVRVLHFANRVLAEYSLNTGTVSRFTRSIDRHLSRHVITAVAGMLCIYLGISFEDKQDPRAEGLLKRDISVLNTAWLEMGEGAGFRKVVGAFTEGMGLMDQKLLYLKLSGTVIVGTPDRIWALREHPLQYFTYETRCGEGESGACEMHVEDKADSLAGAKQNVILVASLLALLALIALTLSASARNELLEPIEKVVQTLDEIMLQPWKRQSIDEHDSSGMMPIKLSLGRIGNLLQLGFGEAGMRTISKSLCEGEIDFDRKGTLVYAIFGFCDIRNFTDCTEVLGAEIVHLVNNIATHVHQAVIDNGGAPNKNIGDAFLLVWKPKGDTNLLEVADGALRSNLTTMLEMQRCPKLRRWEARGEIQARMPGYHVKMGFGLHYGWAIEGAIGSQHKIDASYLSSSVNLASRLEAATKQYGTNILLSGDLYNLLSPKVRNLCRLVDRVTVKGSEHPILLFTYDMPLEELPVSSAASRLSSGKSLGEEEESVRLRAASNEEFFERYKPRLLHAFSDRWKSTVGSYLGGPGGLKTNWAKAEAGLTECLTLKPDDGPATALLEVIQRMGVRDTEGLLCAPPDWRGYRALTDK